MDLMYHQKEKTVYNNKYNQYKRKIQVEDDLLKNRINGQFILNDDVKRSVFVNEHNQNLKTTQDIIFRNGNITVTNLGYINCNPWMHTTDYIYPRGYKAYKIYWSMITPFKRCVYCIEIDETVPNIRGYNKNKIDSKTLLPNDVLCGKPLFKITPLENNVKPMESNNLDGIFYKYIFKQKL